jgi:hypothetical protein
MFIISLLGLFVLTIASFLLGTDACVVTCVAAFCVLLGLGRFLIEQQAKEK